jgi:pimeloyl-ACP methyl ester carboxylesterase
MRKTFAVAVAVAMGAGAFLAQASRAHAEPAKSIVLVHGAFADGTSWAKVIPLLAAKGYTVVAVQNPLSSLADDVAATKRAMEGVPGPVILVGHSWAGVVITEAGNDPKVAGLVYVAAFAPDEGESVNGLGKGKPAPPWAAALQVDSGGFARLPAEIVAKHFAQDVSPAEARIIAATQGPVATRCFDEVVKRPAWRSKPSWFVRTQNDHMIDPAAQAFMAKRMKATVTSLKSSHVPMVSRPKDVAAAILAAAAGKK